MTASPASSAASMTSSFEAPRQMASFSALQAAAAARSGHVISCAGFSGSSVAAFSLAESCCSLRVVVPSTFSRNFSTCSSEELEEDDLLFFFFFFDLPEVVKPMSLCCASKRAFSCAFLEYGSFSFFLSFFFFDLESFFLSFFFLLDLPLLSFFLSFFFFLMSFDFIPLNCVKHTPRPTPTTATDPTTISHGEMPPWPSLPSSTPVPFVAFVAFAVPLPVGSMGIALGAILVFMVGANVDGAMVVGGGAKVPAGRGEVVLALVQSAGPETTRPGFCVTFTSTSVAELLRSQQPPGPSAILDFVAGAEVFQTKFLQPMVLACSWQACWHW
mmetsp:Transcript_170058/g.413386  ORF Transcript_170058/g.413386 Transcript_170058/m.413386 type:complete len:329 (-) Transcript_170058:228-1214(-)